MTKVNIGELLEKHLTDRAVLSEVADLVLKGAGIFAIVGFIAASIPKVAWPYMIAMGLSAAILIALGLMLLMHAAFIIADRPKNSHGIRFASILFVIAIIAMTFCGVGYMFLETMIAAALSQH